MLILTRRKNESLQLGKDIVVSVARIKGNQVKLAIRAPVNVDVVRCEIRQSGGGTQPQDLEIEL